MTKQLTLDATESPLEFKVVHSSSGLVEHHVVGGGVTVAMQRPSRVQPGMSCAGENEPPTVHHFGDAGLSEMVIQKRRAIEDARRVGRNPTPGEFDLRVLVALRHVRFRLRCRYGARDAYGPPGNQGTDVVHQWEALGEPPSYALAFMIDRRRFDAGKSHVVAWGAK